MTRTKITEIMPADRPDWVNDAIAEGRLCSAAIERERDLQMQIENQRWRIARLMRKVHKLEQKLQVERRRQK